MKPIKPAYCSRCNKTVQCHYEPINHGKQLLLTVLTLSMWLPIWLALVFKPTKLCNECNEALWDDDI